MIQRRGIVVLTAADDNFPCSLKNFEDSPVVLYIKGEIDALNQMSVAMVGSRAASYYGCKSAKTFAQGLCRGRDDGCFRFGPRH